MCTAITYHTKDHYFGRNLDYEYDFGEEVVITPRNYPFSFSKTGMPNMHYAIIGMAVVDHEYPLYFDAINECGLGVAALNFPGNAVYVTEQENKTNIAPFIFIPWILSQCECVAQVKKLLKNACITNKPYSAQYPPTPLHWLIADKKTSITVEQTKDGLQIYENLVGVLTNNPTFDYHINNLSNYVQISSINTHHQFSKDFCLMPSSRGTSTLGLPGDLSSASRFIKAAFTKANSISGTTEMESITQFFHILGAVEQQNGCVKVESGYEKTIYTSCCNLDQGIYYYRTYGNSQITGIRLTAENLMSKTLTRFPLIQKQQIMMLN